MRGRSPSLERREGRARADKRLGAARSCRSVTAFGTVDWREAELQTKRLEQAIQRVLRGIVTGVERTEKVRARHAGLSREFLDAYGSNNLESGTLERSRRHGAFTYATCRPSRDRAGALQLTPPHALTFTGAAAPRATYTSVHSLVRNAPRRLSVRV